MSASHHSEEDERRQRELMDRFVKQGTGDAPREYPRGRIGPDDDGAVAMAIAADKKNGIIRIDFNKPVKWFGLGEDETLALIQNLIGKLRQIATKPFSIEVK